MTLTTSLREGLNQNPQFSVNSSSSKNLNSSRAPELSTFQFMELPSRDATLDHRAPSTREKQAAMRAKAKILAKRNWHEIATSVSSTKANSRVQQSQKQLTGSLTRESDNSQVRQNLTQNDDYTRKQQPAKFMSTQKMLGISNQIQTSSS
jgi:hypothetical protein